MLDKDTRELVRLEVLLDLQREQRNPQPTQLKLEVTAQDAAFIVQMLTRRYKELLHKFEQYNDKWEIGEATETEQDRRLNYQDKAEEVKILIDYINDKLNER